MNRVFNSKSEANHEDYLQIVSQRLNDERMYGLFSCEFWFEFVSLLGYVVTKDSVMVNPINILAIHDRARPFPAIEIWSFASLASYYKGFVKGFSSTKNPLTKLTQKYDFLLVV